MLRITICKYTREGHLRVAKPEDPPSVGTKNAFGKMCVTNCGKPVSDEGGVAATPTEFGTDFPQFGACSLSE